MRSAGVALCCGLAISTAAGQPTVTRTGILTGGSSSIATSVSDDGGAVLVTSTAAPPAQSTGLAQYACRWTGHTGLQSLGPVGFPSTPVYAIQFSSSAGRAVCTAGDMYLLRAMFWTSAGGYVGLPLPPSGVQTYAAGISADGSTAVGWSVAGGNPMRATRWPGVAAPTTLGTLPDHNYSSAAAVNRDGSVIVGTSGNYATYSAVAAFRWTAAGGQSFNLIPFEMQGWAFIWTRAAGMQFLETYLAARAVDLTGWNLLDARAATPDARTFVGEGLHTVLTQPLHEGFIVTLWPDPACYANRDGSAASPVLNINDFVVFLSQFVSGSPQSNCDGSTLPPVLNAADFSCFINRFFAGCP